MNINISSIAETLIGLVLFFFSVIIHECAHGWVADKCGDPTARLMGRITLNPIKHIDPFGTIILPLMMAFVGIPPLGWAKPVPVNYYNLRRPKNDMMWVAVAGPLSNLVLAGIGLVVLSVISHFNQLQPVPFSGPIINISYSMIFINILLATFNLIPIPPLDGSRILIGLLPTSLAYKYARLEPFGIIIVFGLFFINGFGWMFHFVQGWTSSIIRIFVGG